jgi:hypothetical protein
MHYCCGCLVLLWLSRVVVSDVHTTRSGLRIRREKSRPLHGRRS